jgi:hypothetical protein
MAVYIIYMARRSRSPSSRCDEDEITECVVIWLHAAQPSPCLASFFFGDMIDDEGASDFRGCEKRWGSWRELLAMKL